VQFEAALPANAQEAVLVVVIAAAGDQAVGAPEWSPKPAADQSITPAASSFCDSAV
jgi:hypothetical protein